MKRPKESDEITARPNEGMPPQTKGSNKSRNAMRRPKESGKNNNERTPP